MHQLNLISHFHFYGFYLLINSAIYAKIFLETKNTSLICFCSLIETVCVNYVKQRGPFHRHLRRILGNFMVGIEKYVI